MSASTDSGTALMRARLAERTPEERLRMVARMFAGARVLVLAGFDGPRDDRAAVRRHVFTRFYGGGFRSAERERVLAYLTDSR